MGVAGSVPIVIGAPNIAQFAPAPNSYLKLDSIDDVPAVVEKVQYLMAHDDEYEKMLEWKKTGGTDQFLAVLDIGNVHSACRLCILLADRQQRVEDEARASAMNDRPCMCQESKKGPVVHHLYVRERGKFYSRSLFLEEPLTIAGLHKTILEEYGGDFRPIWVESRPSFRKKEEDGSWDKTHFELRIHRIFPKGITYKVRH